MVDTRETKVGGEPISCCVITYNEEADIGDCLESVSWADEIVIVDSNSTDRTRDIAGKYGARIIERGFEGHFQQKGFAVDQAKNLWVLCVDADERVTPELKKEILDVMRDPGNTSGFYVPRLTHYLGRFIRHGGWYPDRKLRLFRKDRGRWGGTNPHDRVGIEGDTGYLKGDLIHYTYKDMADHLNKINCFSRIAAEEMIRENRPFRVINLILRGPCKFLKMYILKLGFLDGIAGLVLAVLGGVSVFLKYARLWELVRVKRNLL